MSEIANDEREQVTELADLSADGPAAHLREVERLTRAAVTDRPTLLLDHPPHVAGEILRPGDRLVVENFEHLRPHGPIVPRGTVNVYDAASFVAVVHRYADLERTTLWARQPSTGATVPSVTAIFDDHGGDVGDDDEGHLAAGWREHRAVLEVRMDPDWMAWAAVDGKRMDQVELAEFLNDQLHVITAPRAAELVSAITTFSTRRNVTFSQVVNLDSGEQEFTYLDKQGHEAAGTAVLPNKISLGLRPFYGAPETVLEVWLRYRLDQGRLTFTLTRIRPDRAEEAAWADVCGQIAAELPDFPLLQGHAPVPLRRSS